MNRSIWICAASLSVVIVAGGTLLRAAPVSYTAPEETVTFKKGPGVEAAEANCSACHSADYVNTQPRGAGFGRDFWQAEVTKMINVYKAPISPDDAKKVVDYLASTYK